MEYRQLSGYTVYSEKDIWETPFENFNESVQNSIHAFFSNAGDEDLIFYMPTESNLTFLGMASLENKNITESKFFEYLIYNSASLGQASETADFKESKCLHISCLILDDYMSDKISMIQKIIRYILQANSNYSYLWMDGNEELIYYPIKNGVDRDRAIIYFANKLVK